MTVHTLIGSELLVFLDLLREGQFVANLIHHPPGVYTAYLVDTKPQPQLIQTNEIKTC